MCPPTAVFKMSAAEWQQDKYENLCNEAIWLL